MNVKLISYTQPATYSDLADSTWHNGWDLEDLIVYTARVSNPSSQQAGENNERLIKYLIDHKHWSPFEMADVTVEINTTRDIGRQILRHRSFSFQEFSQRYAEAMSFESSEARLQDPKNRQSSKETNNEDLKDWWWEVQVRLMERAQEGYRLALESGIAKEVARKILPEGLTMTKMYMKGSIRSWIHYIEVRTDPSTQKEHREVALACAEQIARVFPSIKLFVKGA